MTNGSGRSQGRSAVLIRRIVRILGCLRLLLDEQADALEVKREAHDAYNGRIDAANARMAWGASDVNTWYKNEKGRVSQNWPYILLEFWQMTRQPEPEDYRLIR